MEINMIRSPELLNDLLIGIEGRIKSEDGNHMTRARILRTQLKAFIAGMENKVLDDSIWLEEFKKLTVDKDPEYLEYLRLKEKFE